MTPDDYREDDLDPRLALTELLDAFADQATPEDLANIRPVRRP